MWNRFTKFISDIVRKDKDESAKRIVALFISVTLIVLLFMYTRVDNIVSITWAVISFVCALLGVAAWEDVATKRLNNLKKEKEENKP